MSWLRLAVVGGVNLDILGAPDGRYVAQDSMIGHIRFVCGGVGRNIAAQAVHTGADVRLYTVFGDDRHAEWLRMACYEDGLKIDHAVSLHGPSPVYMAIHGTDGDMVSAVNDMSLLAQFTPAVLSQMIPDINQADVCVADANLPEETLASLSEQCDVPLVCDPVSMAKAQRLMPFLPRLTAIKPNRLEAQAMTGTETPAECADRLLARGVRMVFISLGKDGLYYADDRTCGLMTPERISTQPQTGAGDAVTAGIAAGIGWKLDVVECARLGMQSAARHLHKMISV